MEAEVRIDKVDAVQTRGGNTRFVVRDDQGREYTTFRPSIGSEAQKLEGRRVRVEYHEDERNGFKNVWLDKVTPGPEEAPRGAGGSSTDPDEAAWSTAIEAAPWVLGTNEPDGEVPPEELFEKLEPFKRLVAEDIRQGGEEEEQGK
jgi:hypothetical protein